MKTRIDPSQQRETADAGWPSTKSKSPKVNNIVKQNQPVTKVRKLVLGAGVGGGAYDSKKKATSATTASNVRPKALTTAALTANSRCVKKKPSSAMTRDTNERSEPQVTSAVTQKEVMHPDDVRGSAEEAFQRNTKRTNLVLVEPKTPPQKTQISRSSVTSQPSPQVATDEAAKKAMSQYDKEAAREYMRKQQDLRKDKEYLEQKTKAEGKQLIKQRLRQLQETQKNLVKANVEARRNAQKMVAQKSPSPQKRATMGHQQKEPVASRQRLLTPSKSPMQSPLPSKSPELRVSTPKMEQKLAQGLLRGSSCLVQDDIYSPLKLCDITTQQREGMNFSRFSNVTNLGDISNLERSSFMVHDTPKRQSPVPTKAQKPTTPVASKPKAIVELKPPEPLMKSLSPQKSANEVWKEPTPASLFDFTHLKTTPYNFLTALNRKLEATKKLDSAEKDVKDVALQVEEPKPLPRTINFTRPVLQETPSEENYTEIKTVDNITQSSKVKDTVDTVSEVSSMKSESISLNTSPDSKKENLSVETSLRRQDISIKPEPLKDQNGNGRFRTETERFVKKNLEKIQEVKTYDATSSVKSDDIVIRKPHYVNAPQSKANRDEHYQKLLSDFKSSLQNFVELNQKLKMAKVVKAPPTASEHLKSSIELSSKILSTQESKSSQDPSSEVQKEAPKSLESATSYSNSFDSGSSLASTVTNERDPIQANLNDLVLSRSSAKSTSQTSSKVSFEEESVPNLSKTESSKQEPAEEQEEKVSTEKSSSVPSMPSPKKLSFELSPKKEETDTVAYDEDSLASIETESNVSNLNISFSTVGMVDQLIYNSVLEENHILGVCEIRAKSIIDKLKSQLSYLEVKKQKYKQLLKEQGPNEKYNEELYSIRKKQRGIIMKLEQARKSLQVIRKLESSGIVTHEKTASFRRKSLNRELLQNSVQKRSRSEVSNLQLKPLKCFDNASTDVIEKFMMKREEKLLERRQKLDQLLQWQKKLDEEEAVVLEMENDLVAQNIAQLNSATETPSKSEESAEVQEPPKAPESPKEIVLTGSELNALWLRLTGRQEEKYDPSISKALSQNDLKEIYEQASDVVLGIWRETDEPYLLRLVQSDVSSFSSLTSVSQQEPSKKEDLPAEEPEKLLESEEEKSHSYSDTFNKSSDIPDAKEQDESEPPILPSLPIPEAAIEEISREESNSDSEVPIQIDIPQAESISEAISDHEVSNESSKTENSERTISEIKFAQIQVPGTETCTNGLPDIISEAEVLRIQQMQIEQEIEQLQRQVSFSIALEKRIPNKPPPPYTLPSEPEVSDTITFPSFPVIQALVAIRVEQLHRPKSSVNESCENLTANIYERLIIDMTEEFYYQTVLDSQGRSVSKVSGCGMKSFFQQFFNTPEELPRLQDFIFKKVMKICVPLADSNRHLDEMALKKNGKGKDLVDQILFTEIAGEEWSCFDEEETEIKDALTRSFMKMLVAEAVEDILHIL